MWIDFNDLPESARIWIYQPDQEIDAQKEAAIRSHARKFIDRWEAHGKPLESSVEIFHGRFVVIGVNENFNPVTGCSTDASVDFIRSLGVELQIDFFNRLNLPIMVDGSIELIPLQRFKKKDIPEEVTTDSITFDNLINQKGQLEESWKRPVSETWLAKYM
jgi:hypothetical protein